MQFGRLVVCWQRFSLANLSRQKEQCEAGMDVIFKKLVGLEKQELKFLAEGRNTPSMSTKRRISHQLSVLRQQMLELHMELKLLKTSTRLALRQIGSERRSIIAKRFSLTSDTAVDADVDAQLADERLEAVLVGVEDGTGESEFQLNADAILAELGVESNPAETAPASSASVGIQAAEPGGNGQAAPTDPLEARNAASVPAANDDSVPNSTDGDGGPDRSDRVDPATCST